MPSILLLRGVGSDPPDLRLLDARDEENLAPAFRQLMSYTVEVQRGAIAHERDGEIIAAWNEEGALRLAELLPPAYSELAEAILQRHRPSGVRHAGG